MYTTKAFTQCVLQNPFTGLSHRLNHRIAGISKLLIIYYWQCITDFLGKAHLHIPWRCINVKLHTHTHTFF